MSEKADSKRVAELEGGGGGVSVLRRDSVTKFRLQAIGCCSGQLSWSPYTTTENLLAPRSQSRPLDVHRMGTLYKMLP